MSLFLGNPKSRNSAVILLISHWINFNIWYKMKISGKKGSIQIVESI